MPAVKRPTAQQLDSLIVELKNDPNIPLHWDVSSGTFYSRLTNKTLKQYKFILALLYQHEYIKLNKLFEDFNLPRK